MLFGTIIWVHNAFKFIAVSHFDANKYICLFNYLTEIMPFTIWLFYWKKVVFKFIYYFFKFLGKIYYRGYLQFLVGYHNQSLLHQSVGPLHYHADCSRRKIVDTYEMLATLWSLVSPVKWDCSSNIVSPNVKWQPILMFFWRLTQWEGSSNIFLHRMDRKSVSRNIWERLQEK